MRIDWVKSAEFVAYANFKYISTPSIVENPMDFIDSAHIGSFSSIEKKILEMNNKLMKWPESGFLNHSQKISGYLFYCSNTAVDNFAHRFKSTSK